MKKLVKEFLKAYGTKVRSNESSAHVDLMMDEDKQQQPHLYNFTNQNYESIKNQNKRLINNMLSLDKMNIIIF